MKSVSFLALLSGPALVLALPPSRTLEPRAATFCDQWGSVETGGYMVYNNLWGQSSADSGRQCTTVTSVSGTGGSLAWSTEWTWAGDQYSVKSYANAVRQVDRKPLSQVSSIPSTWSWR